MTKNENLKTEKHILIMLTNNSIEDPFLYSQLLDVYSKNSTFKEFFVFCGNATTNKLEYAKVVSNGLNYNNFIKRYLSFYKNLCKLLYKNREHELTIHLRGFISGIIYFFTPKFIKGNAKYIYDPRGAVVYSLIEKNNKIKPFEFVLRYIDRSLIKNSIFTIVESKKLKKLKSELYNGTEEKYLVCYNTSSLLRSEDKLDIKNLKSVNICYPGSINYWHDIDEIYRVLKFLKTILEKENKIVKLHILTQDKYKSIVETTLRSLDNGGGLVVKFVPYKLLDKELQKMHICISVTRPTKYTRANSPIKISDFIVKNKIFMLNSGIGDFDEFFESNNSAILYDYTADFNLKIEDIYKIDCYKNKEIEHHVLIETNRKKIYNKLQNLI